MWSSTGQLTIQLPAVTGTKYLTFAIDTATSGKSDSQYPSHGVMTISEPAPPCQNQYFAARAVDMQLYGSSYAYFAVERTGSNTGAATVEVTVTYYHDQIGIRTETRLLPFAAGEMVKVVPTLVRSADAGENLQLGMEVKNFLCSSTSTVTSISTAQIVLTGSWPSEGPRVVGVAVDSSTAVNPSYNIPFGSGGDQLLPVPLGTLDTIQIAFDKPVTISGSSLELVGLKTSNTYSLTFLGTDLSSKIATWKLANNATFAQADRMYLRLNDTVTDLVGQHLDGEWLNPVALGDRKFQTPESGDGHAGGKFELGFVIVPGDGNQDWYVDGTDFGIWNSNKFTLNTDWRRGDYNGDGVTDGSDFGIWNAWKFTSVHLTTFADLNHDGVVAASDIDYLYDAIFSRRAADTFDDLDGNGVVSVVDMTYYLDEILDIVYGDIDMDGDVDSVDQALFGGGLGWAGGDFNGDGIVNQLDYDLAW